MGPGGSLQLPWWVLVEVERSHPRGMGCTWAQLNPACPELCPPRRQVTAQSFMKYSLCCPSPLALGLTELLAPTVQLPASSSPSKGRGFTTA